MRTVRPMIVAWDLGHCDWRYEILFIEGRGRNYTAKTDILLPLGPSLLGESNFL